MEREGVIIWLGVEGERVREGGREEGGKEGEVCSRYRFTVYLTKPTGSIHHLTSFALTGIRDDIPGAPLQQTIGYDAVRYG